MVRKLYEIVEMPNGLKMMAVLPINETGIAEAYATVRDNPLLGTSKGYSGYFSANLYKKLGVEEGCQDFRTACEALGISDRQVITNRLTAFTDIVRNVPFASRNPALRAKWLSNYFKTIWGRLFACPCSEERNN